MPIDISTPLALPCGATLRNRIAKAGLTEGLANLRNQATEAHCRLYRRWSLGGAGLLLTGNVLIDRSCMERPLNVAVDGNLDEGGRAALAAWARAGTEGGNAFWMQINHAGRKSPASITPQPVAPSAIPIGAAVGPGRARRHGVPRALDEGEIEALIDRYVATAVTAREAGFTGVQFHAAHGYLLAEFLSPLANHRQDEWGGALENRARMLLEVVRRARQALGADYPIGVKMNSADFQRGGFTPGEAEQVALWLQAAGVDLLELSGGSSESYAMLGQPGESEESALLTRSTAEREAYFVLFAEAMRKVLDMPVMVTGGFRSRRAMDAALAAGAVDIVGLGRPMCLEPDLPRRLLADRDAVAPSPEADMRPDPAAAPDDAPPAAVQAALARAPVAYFAEQMVEMGAGRAPDLKLGLYEAGRRYLEREAEAAAAWCAARADEAA
ncbi:2,4-dienoyl-CoA reductase [Marinibaculum pumilum]|uniref:2,4-dienoyl-CoA reductase n=1 Tax=Marinibaculum pumilum TaxID=1766165 RepID=A0ABV7L249_9PROT